MKTKYDQLAQLKTLLDSGALTQEEFDAAKKRILDSVDTPQPKESSEDASLSENKVSSSAKKLPKWIIPAAIGVIAVIVIIVVSIAGRKDSMDTSYTADEEILEDTIAYADEDDEYALNDGLTLGNPWRKDYFKNEWGEINENSPMIYAIIKGSGWDIHIDYVPPTDELRWGLFRFYLLDDDGHLTNSYGPVSILIRDYTGNTESIEVTGTKDGVTFVEDPTYIEMLKHYLDQEQFDIQMEYEKYNERHRTQAHWDASLGSFGEAVNNLL